MNQSMEEENWKGAEVLNETLNMKSRNIAKKELKRRVNNFLERK